MMRKHRSIQTFRRVKAPEISHVGFSWRTYIDCMLLTTGIETAVGDKQVQIYTSMYNTGGNKAKRHPSSLTDLHESV